MLVVTSAGCNALDYALTGPRHIHAVDLNVPGSAARSPCARALVAEWQAILARASTARAIWRSGGLRTDFLDCVNVVQRPRAAAARLLSLSSRPGCRSPRPRPDAHLWQLRHSGRDGGALTSPSGQPMGFRLGPQGPLSLGTQAGAWRQPRRAARQLLRRAGRVHVVDLSGALLDIAAPHCGSQVVERAGGTRGRYDLAPQPGIGRRGDVVLRAHDDPGLVPGSGENAWAMLRPGGDARARRRPLSPALPAVSCALLPLRRAEIQNLNDRDRDECSSAIHIPAHYLSVRARGRAKRGPRWALCAAARLHHGRVAAVDSPAASRPRRSRFRSRAPSGCRRLARPSGTDRSGRAALNRIAPEESGASWTADPKS